MASATGPITRPVTPALPLTIGLPALPTPAGSLGRPAAKRG
jgi:hypothetical protein